jgi:hypothetical protein
VKIPYFQFILPSVDIPLASAPPASNLPDYVATMPPPSQPPPPPYPPGLPHPPHWGQQHPGDGFPTSFGRGRGRQGGGRGGRGRGPSMRGRGYNSGGYFLGRGRGNGSGGGSRGNALPHAANIEAYFSPQMLSNPWSHLERQQRPAYQGGGTADGGRLDRDGIFDRPWH